MVRRRGVGTQVVHSKVRRPLELSSLYDDLEAAGRRPATSVLRNTTEPATAEVAAALGVAEEVRSTSSNGCAAPTANRWPSCATTCPSGCCP